VPMPRIPIRADVKVATEKTIVAIRGPQTDAQLRALYSRAAIYAATSRYEPFGLAPLEAAFSRCAIVANDIPSFREIWGETVCYFRPNDPLDLQAQLESLQSNRELRLTYANLAYNRARVRYTAERMVDDYLNLYTSLVKSDVLAACANASNFVSLRTRGLAIGITGTHTSFGDWFASLSALVMKSGAMK